MIYRIQVVKALLDAKASSSTIDRYGATPLQWAIHSGHDEVAALLKKRATHVAAPSPKALGSQGGMLPAKSSLQGLKWTIPRETSMLTSELNSF